MESVGQSRRRTVLTRIERKLHAEFQLDRFLVGLEMTPSWNTGFVCTVNLSPESRHCGREGVLSPCEELASNGALSSMMQRVALIVIYNFFGSVAHGTALSPLV
jgi:hypothetical protein